MTGYINKFDEDKNKNKNKNKLTMPFKVRDKFFFKNYNKIWKKNWKFMRIHFNTKPPCGNDDKYIKIKRKTYKDSITTHFYNKKGLKNTRRKNTSMFIINNSRFCSLCIWKVSPPNIFRRM